MSLDQGQTKLWVGVCGPLSIRQGDTEIRAIPAGQRAVLALLALADGAAVLPDSVIAALWPDKDPPTSASSIVHTYVSRLRSLFKTNGDGKSLISRDGSGYRLRLAADQLDLLAFRQLVGSARVARDANEACDLYEQAIRLWRGDPVEDIDILRTHPAVTSLTNERVIVTLEYAQRAAAIGRHAAVLPHLEPLAASNPLDERLHAALMIAMAGSGRQAESLHRYDDLRRKLDEELGMPPGEELRDAHQRVLRQQVTDGKREDSWPRVHQLPAAPADFTGRTTERDALMHAIIASRDRPGVQVAVVSGQPGVGKTALALYVTHAVSQLFPDGQLWVQLAGASARPRDPGEVLGEMLRTFGVPGSAIPDDQSARSAALRSALAGRKVLILADDAASAGQVASLVPGTPGCALIVTSRVELHGLEGAAQVPLGVLGSHEAIQFLGKLASHQRVAADLAAATRLTQACGGLPLALRIVGSRLATRPQWPLSTMVRKLTQSQNRLRELEAGTMSVRASIDSSYTALPERDRLAFRRLTLLGPNDFAGWVVEVLLGESAAEGVLDNLVGRSLITPAGVDDTGEPRYRLHDLLRDYAAEQLAADAVSGTDSAVERLLYAWLQLAQCADAALPPEPYFPPARQRRKLSVLAGGPAREITRGPIAWLTAERINLLAAVEQACERGRLDLARAIASCHSSFHYLQDRHDESERMWRRVATSTDKSANGVWARLRLGASLIERGRAGEAFPVLDGCIAAAERLEDEDPELLAFALYWRGSCSWDMDIFGQAQADAERGAAIAQRKQLRLAEIHNLRRLSSTVAHEGQGGNGVASAERAAAIAAESFGGSWYELTAIHNLAFVCSLAGRYERAVEVSVRSIKLSRELGSIREEALSYGVLGDAYRGLGEYQSSIDALLHALALFRVHHADRHTALCLLKLGYAYEGAGRCMEAIGYLEQAGELFQALRLAHRVELAQEALVRCRAEAALASSTGSL